MKTVIFYKKDQIKEQAYHHRNRQYPDARIIPQCQDDLSENSIKYDIEYRRHCHDGPGSSAGHILREELPDKHHHGWINYGHEKSGRKKQI